MPRLSLVIFILGLLASCTPATPPKEPVGHELHRLYFGRGTADGGEVSHEQWNEFLRLEVTPLYPDGLTHWPSQGQWRGEDGSLSKENSFLLEIIVPPEDREASTAAMRTIIDAYKKQFEQESVLWIRDDVTVEFR